MQRSFFATFAIEVLFVFSTAVTNVLLDGTCAAPPRILADVSALSYMDLFDVLLGERVGPDDAAPECSGEFEFLLLGAVHIHKADRVGGEVYKVCVSLVLLVRVLFHGVDKRKVNCLSSSALV